MHETKNFNIPCSLHGKLFLSHELFSVFVVFNEKFDLFAKLFHFPAKMQTRFFHVSYSVSTRNCTRYV